MSSRLLTLALALTLAAPPSQAELGTIDPVPAATLLLPYFEVDLADPNGITTVFTIVNSGQFGLPPAPAPTTALATLVHVTLWTDLGIPTFAFDVYLTGFDVAAINLRDVFAGILPTSASAGQDVSDTVSPQGGISQDINYASCLHNLPYPVPALTTAEITALQDAHTGKASSLLGDLCGGRALGDQVARGFVTVDAVAVCSPLFPPTTPASPFYFSDKAVAVMGNRLAGDFMFVDLSENLAQGDALVPIEIDTGSPPSFTSGEYTFYGRLVGGDASDLREPLPTTWQVPFVDKPAHAAGTELIVWRDPIINPAPFPCGGSLPAPFPLGTETLLAIDVAGNAEGLAPADPPFPVVAMRTTVNGPAPTLPVTPRAGWLHLDLNSPELVPESPFTNKQRRQSWVVAITKAAGRLSSAHAAVSLREAKQ